MGSKTTGGSRFKPGQSAPHSGQYGLVGPRGGMQRSEITGVKGHTLPPTPKPGQGYVLVDPTKNGAGGKK